jgi:hypothetical protein
VVGVPLLENMGQNQTGVGNFKSAVEAFKKDVKDAKNTNKRRPVQPYSLKGLIGK